jgi:hypothetical protein
MKPTTKGELVAALGPAVAEVFSRHLEGATATALDSLAGQFEHHLTRVRDCLATNEFLDVRLAERLALTCNQLLECCDRSDAGQVALVVAAVRYFLDPNDAEADCESLLGFDDDAQVVNYVIRRTGLPVELVKTEEE